MLSYITDHEKGKFQVAQTGVYATISTVPSIGPIDQPL